MVNRCKCECCSQKMPSQCFPGCQIALINSPRMPQVFICFRCSPRYHSDLQSITSASEQEREPICDGKACWRTFYCRRTRRSAKLFEASKMAVVHSIGPAKCRTLAMEIHWQILLLRLAEIPTKKRLLCFAGEAGQVIWISIFHVFSPSPWGLHLASIGAVWCTAQALHRKQS